MRRLKGDMVELNPTETRAYERFQALLNEGYSTPAATEKLRKEFSLSFTFQEWLMNP